MEYRNACLLRMNLAPYFGASSFPKMQKAIDIQRQYAILILRKAPKSIWERITITLKEAIVYACCLCKGAFSV